MNKGDKILGKDLKPGMAIKSTKHSMAKLVIDIDLVGDNELFDGEPSMHFFDLNDAYYGPCSVWLGVDDEYEILYEPNTEEYKDMVETVHAEMNSNIRATNEAIEELGQLTEEYVK